MTFSSPTLRTASKPPSIREIARHAGVSASTVSRVLNQKTMAVPIAQDTRQKVLDACQRLCYQPNVHALRLFGGRSNSIALMIPPRGQVLPGAASYADPNLFKTTAGVLDVATERGQHLVLVASDQQVIAKDEHLNLFRSRSIDGMLIWGAVEQDWRYIEQLVAEGWPVVLVNSHVADESVPHVLVDNWAGGAALADHLIECGHRRIAFLAGPESASVGAARRMGFEDACRETGIQPVVLYGNFSIESGCELADQLLASSSPPTAISAVDDLMAMGVIEAAEARGLNVPFDLSVTGADDAFPYRRPRLTTFAAPMEELGRRALNLLLGLVEDAAAWSTLCARRGHVCSGQLIVRQTTAAPRGGRR